MLLLLNTFYPEKAVKISNRDPDYMTPAIQMELKRRNKLMRQGNKEKAEALTRRIGILIAKRNSTMIKSKGGKVTSRDMWAAVRKLSNRATPSDQTVAGIDAGLLNEHYAGISHDANYVAPPKKATANAEDELVTEFQVFHLLDTTCSNLRPQGLTSCRRGFYELERKCSPNTLPCYFKNQFEKVWFPLNGSRRTFGQLPRFHRQLFQPTLDQFL